MSNEHEWGESKDGVWVKCKMDGLGRYLFNSTPKFVLQYSGECKGKASDKKK